MSDVTAAVHLISGLMMEMPGGENAGNWRQYWVSGCDRMCAAGMSLHSLEVSVMNFQLDF